MKHRALSAVVAVGLLSLAACGAATDSAGGHPSGADRQTGRSTGSATPTTGSSAHGGSKAGSTAAPRRSGDAGATSSAAPTRTQRPGQTTDDIPQPTHTGKQVAVLSRVPGSASTGCVDVGSWRDARSGGLLAGPFDTVRASYGHKQPGMSARKVRLYFVPMHARTMPGVTLTFTNLATGDRVTTRQKLVGDAEQWKFYDTTTVLDHGGTWRVRAVAGADRGCFVFTIPQR